MNAAQQLEVRKAGMPPLVLGSTHVDPEGTLCLALSRPIVDTETALCPLCPEDVGPQPIDNFGICCARKTGRNLYCKACLRQKVAESRGVMRAYLKAKREQQAQGKLPLLQGVAKRRDGNGILLGPEIRDSAYPAWQRVLGAVHAGARTYKEIMRDARLTSDTVGDALAELMLDSPRLVESREVLDTPPGERKRQYFPVTSAPKPNQSAPIASLFELGGIVAPIMKGRRVA